MDYGETVFARRRVSSQPGWQRITSLPGELEKGDVLRDYGIERTVARVEQSPSTLIDLVAVHFDPAPDRPELPNELVVPQAETVTAWRMDVQ